MSFVSEICELSSRAILDGDSKSQYRFSLASPPILLAVPPYDPTLQPYPAPKHAGHPFSPPLKAPSKGDWTQVKSPSPSLPPYNIYRKL